MRDNIITAAASATGTVVTQSAYQYDYGLRLEVTGIELPAVTEWQFANSASGAAAKTTLGDSTGCDIPNDLLISGEHVYAWLFIHETTNDGFTVYTFDIPVIQRTRPVEEEPTPEQAGLISQAIAALNEAVEDTTDAKEAAETAATDAAASAVAAGNHADAAEAAEINAQNYATDAQGYANAASASAGDAEGFATAAATSETNAASSATSAADNATAAGLAKDSASASATSAAGYATSASASATTAGEKAVEASASATAAAGSATAASGSADDASDSAIVAAGAATDASASATTAAGSATSAANSATAAAGSATAAAQSAATAASTVSGAIGAIEAKGAEVIESIPEDYTELSADVTQLKSDFDAYAPIWQNLFNPNDSDIAYGQRVNTDNGNMITDSNCNTTGYIPIEPNKYYSTRVLSSYLGTNAKWIIYYNQNKARLGQISGTYLEDTGRRRALKFIVTNEEVAYTRLIYSADDDSFMVVEGETYPSDYLPYGKAFNDIINLNSTQLEQVNKIVEQQTGGSNLLYGKKIAYNGDSICESRLATGNSYNGGAYPKLIADTVGGTYENRAIGGGILASTPGDGGSVPSRCVVSDISNMAADADMVCFEGGINDYWRKVPIGTLTAESDLTGTVDTATIIGALESIFRQAKSRWLGKPICFVIVHKIQNTYYTQNSVGYSWKDVHDAIVNVCNKYAVPYYDACLGSGLNGHDATQSNEFLTSNTEGSGDGCHPNEAGYRRYYVPQLISFFESIMPRLSE